MPIYEYQCLHCGHQFEVMQKMADAPLNTCPECDTDQLARLVSATSFQLKGSGWYVTDFKNKSKPEKNSGEKQPTAQKENNKTEKSDKEK